MNTKDLMLGIFVILTVVFASLAASEYVQTNVLDSQIHTTSNSTTCTVTSMPAAISECPHFFNQTYIISVSYGGPWGASYQGYLGNEGSGQLVESGSFYGHAPGNGPVTVTGWSASGEITLCAEAQKLDASNSTLVLTILPTTVTNQTSLAYGTTKSCLADVII
jgi:hypothetical protein